MARDVHSVGQKFALAQIGRRLETLCGTVEARTAAAIMNDAAVRLGFRPKLLPTIPDTDVREALRAWCIALEIDVCDASVADDTLRISG